MNGRPACGCGASGRLDFACSGAADVGAVADRAARDLQSGMAAFICCTAAVAAEVPVALFLMPCLHVMFHRGSKPRSAGALHSG